MCRRQYFLNGFIALIVVSVLIPVGALLLNNYFYNVELIKTIATYMLLIPPILIMCLFIYLFIKYKGKIIKGSKLNRCLEKALISIKAYEKEDNVNYLKLPKIQLKENVIYIYFKNNLKIRNAVEKDLKIWSTALPKNYIVDETELNESGDYLKISYLDLNEYKQESYSLKEYVEKVRVMTNKSELYFDKRNIIDLNYYPHILCVGATRSGKSYLAQQLLFQQLYRKWNCYILDCKGTYAGYKDYATYEDDPIKIIDVLKDLEEKMNQRKQEMQKHLINDSSALAIDLGFKPVYILIEEYSSLVGDVSLDKKQVEELKRLVAILVQKGAQLAFHVCITSQTSGVDVIETKIKSNLSIKILLGNAPETVQKSTFNLESSDIPKISFKGQGQGLIQQNKLTSIRVPKVDGLTKNFKDYL